MKYKLLIFLAISLFTFTSCNAKDVQYKRISAEEAIKMMDTEKDYIILDVRTKEEYESRHIKNAILVPNETIGKEEIKQLPNKDQLILVYCRSGNRSRQAAQKLIKLGYTNVYDFGGINSYPGEIVT